MALALGTNCGFVTTAPTADPVGASLQVMDARSCVLQDTSASNAAKIVEIGWWANEATEASNFEVGLYAADGVVVPGEAGTLLQVARTNAKGTGAGWKVVTVDWSISPSTSYWLAVQLDNTTTTTNIDADLTSGNGIDFLPATQTTLNDPFGGGALGDSSAMLAVYAVWQAITTTSTSSSSSSSSSSSNSTSSSSSSTLAPSKLFQNHLRPRIFGPGIAR